MSESGFRAAGRPVGEATAALVRSVQLATEAASDAPGQRWVAASIGPYGATLADGSEYTGAYDLDEQALRSWHRPRIEALAAAGPDVFAIETIASAVEARAILDACAAVGVRAWLSLTVADGRRRGDPPEHQASPARRDAACSPIQVRIECAIVRFSGCLGT